jgi:tRNA A37 threonylcarbamoyladenosine dehydratase
VDENLNMTPDTLNQDPEGHLDTARRFGGVARLYGSNNAARIAASHVAVVGLGGVGSWSAEALARSGVGALTLVDLDHIAESNINRQVHALDGEIGRAKVEAMAHRIGLINPLCKLHVVDDFLSAANASDILARCDGVIDAVDDVRAKVAMVLFARDSRVPLVVCGGAGAKRDLTRLRVEDLALTHNDALLARLRSRLRAEHGYPRGTPGGKHKGKPEKFGVACVYLDEPAPQAVQLCDVEGDLPGAKPNDPSAGLNCAGYGSVVHVTAGIGLAAAGWMLERLTQRAI